jgi:hypothetical protein
MLCTNMLNIIRQCIDISTCLFRWLRRKYEQSKEEKRRLINVNKRQYRSIKRQRLQRDIQLAKLYGY